MKKLLVCLALVSATLTAVAGVSDPTRLYFVQYMAAPATTATISSAGGTATPILGTGAEEIRGTPAAINVRSLGRYFVLGWHQWTPIDGDSTAVQVLGRYGLPQIGSTLWSTKWDTLATVYGLPAESTAVRARFSLESLSLKPCHYLWLRFQTMSVGSDSTTIENVYYYGDDGR